MCRNLKKAPTILQCFVYLVNQYLQWYLFNTLWISITFTKITKLLKLAHYKMASALFVWKWSVFEFGVLCFAWEPIEISLLKYFPYIQTLWTHNCCGLFRSLVANFIFIFFMISSILNDTVGKQYVGLKRMFGNVLLFNCLYGNQVSLIRLWNFAW